jgi:mono/diheme cytochrome c family protein
MFREAHVAALMQVCGPEQGAMRRGLTRHVAGVAHAESSRALAKLAIFSPEEEVRRDAIDSLKIRRDKDYGDILVGGLRYPWPEVARRATEAIVALERKDLLPALVNSLDEADPRLPRETTVKGKKAHVVDEMVRVNHHRNCFLCHAPADGTGEVLSGAVPIPGEPLPSFQDGYRNSTPELAVRIDVTYLRQDFSTFMKVENANPWPEMQRFDFLVRTRTVAGEEMEAFTKLSASADEGVLNPYHRAAVQALRELTGRDAAPTAEAWRRLLKLPARGS